MTPRASIAAAFKKLPQGRPSTSSVALCGAFFSIPVRVASRSDPAINGALIFGTHYQQRVCVGVLNSYKVDRP